MVATVLYLPGIQEKQLIKKLVDLGDLIRADIHRYLRYEVKSEKEIDTQKVYILMKRCKSRILGRLEKVIKMPSEYDKTDEEWEEILKKISRKDPVYRNNSNSYSGKDPDVDWCISKGYNIK